MAIHRVVIDPWPLSAADKRKYGKNTAVKENEPTVRVADLMIGRHSQAILAEILGSNCADASARYRRVIATSPTANAYVFVPGKTDNTALGSMLDVNLSLDQSRLMGYAVNLDEMVLTHGLRSRLVKPDGSSYAGRDRSLTTDPIDGMFSELEEPMSVREALAQNLTGSGVILRIEEQLSSLVPRAPERGEPH